MNINLNLKSIILFEMYANKPFSKLNLSDENDLMKLLYCVIISNDNELITYDEFLKLIECKKITKQIIEKFKKELFLIDQFTVKKQIINDEINSNNNDDNYMKDIATLLIINAGMDANFVLEKMKIYELNLYVDAYNQHVKQEMESKRLFTYLSILPHIDSKKINSPKKLISFFWDDDETETIDEKQAIKEIANEFESMFENGAKLIEKINKQKQENNI